MHLPFMCLCPTRNRPIVHSAVNDRVLVQLKLSPSPHRICGAQSERSSTPSCSGRVLVDTLFLYLRKVETAELWSNKWSRFRFILALCLCLATTQMKSDEDVEPFQGWTKEMDSTWMAYKSVTGKGLNTLVIVQFLLFLLIMKISRILGFRCPHEVLSID